LRTILVLVASSLPRVLGRVHQDWSISLESCALHRDFHWLARSPCHKHKNATFVQRPSQRSTQNDVIKRLHEPEIMFVQERYSDEKDDGRSLRDVQARLRAEGLAGEASSQTYFQQDTEPLAQQPLLNQIHDEKNQARYRGDYDGEQGDPDREDSPRWFDLHHGQSCVSRTRRYVRSRSGAKLFAYLVVVALAILSFVYFILYPEIVDNGMEPGFVNPIENGQEKLNTYGMAQGGEYQHGAVKIQDLDEMYIPGGEEDPHGERRLIFIGDIHGCKKELLKLLEKVDFDPAWDHLIATGDTINKGPHSAGVLDHLIHLNATTVRGNHEDRLIHTAKNVFDAFASSPEDSLPPLQDTDSLVDVTSASHRDAKTLKSLRARHLRYIQHMPLILRIRALPQAGKPTTSSTSPVAEPIVVVHAGLVPAVPLEKQDPYYVTNMRSLHPKSHVPSADRAGKGGKKVGRHNKPWRNVWNWYNDRLFRHKSTKGFRKFDTPVPGTVVTAEKRDLYGDGQDFVSKMFGSVEGETEDSAGNSKKGHEKDEKPQVVIYGHDAKSGLRIKRWSKGMDSACVGGGKLSALVLNAKGEGKVVSVGCKQYW
jgi:hypothetical protein